MASNYANVANFNGDYWVCEVCNSPNNQFSLYCIRCTVTRPETTPLLNNTTTNKNTNPILKLRLTGNSNNTHKMNPQNPIAEDDVIFCSILSPKYSNNHPSSDDQKTDPYPRPSAPILPEYLYDSLLDAPASFDYSFMEHSEREALESINKFLMSNELYQKPANFDEEGNNNGCMQFANNPILYPNLDSITAKENDYIDISYNPIALNESNKPALLADSEQIQNHPSTTSPPLEPKPLPRTSLFDTSMMDSSKEVPKAKRRIGAVNQVKRLNYLYNEAARQYEEILTFLNAQKLNFVDPSFRPAPTSLYFKSAQKDKTSLGLVEWLRPQNIKTHFSNHIKWSVTNNPSQADVCQGHLGNCWFLSAISLVAEKIHLIDNILITKKISPQGIYQVRLCVHGKWEVILVDDFFPCYKKNKQQMYSQSIRNQLWVSLIEKAAAKVHGCYEALNAGSIIEGLSILTGSPCEKIHLQSDDFENVIDPRVLKESLWHELLIFKHKGYLVGASTGNRFITTEVYKELGLNANHAYSVLDVNEIAGNRLLLLRDPNGVTQWRGDWSDKSKKWTIELKKALLPCGASEGVFWISLDDFCNYFSQIDVCKIRPDYNEAREDGIFPPLLECPSPIYMLEVFSRTDIEVCLYQPNKRYRENEDKNKVIDLFSEPTDLSAMILKINNGDVSFNEDDLIPFPTSIVEFVGRSYQCCVSRSLTFDKGLYVIAPQSYSHWANQGIVPYTLATFSSLAHTLEPKLARPGFIIEAIYLLAKKYGKKDYLGKSSNMCLYFLSKHFAQGLLLLENGSQNHITVTINASNCQNIVSTRDALFTRDCLAPLHKQVLNIFSKEHSRRDISFAFEINYELSDKNELGEYGSTHFPQLTETNRELHSPTIIY